jgi:hypothetical protein
VLSVIRFIVMLTIHHLAATVLIGGAILLVSAALSF